jgi:hypothetical protein
MAWPLERSKIKTLKNCTDPLFGPKEAVDEKGMERRKALAERAKIIYELLKSTQLVMDLLHWRRSDLRLAEQEEDVSNGNQVEKMQEAKRKTLKECIARLARVVRPTAPDAPEPTIGLGRQDREDRTVRQVKGYQLEGLEVDEEEEGRKEKKKEDILDAGELYYLCDKVTDAEFLAETDRAWEPCEDSAVYRSCLSIRRHLCANDVPWLADPRKQQLLTEVEALKGRNDWILDPKHVYRRSVLKASSPSWAEPVERMERWYRTIWEPSILERVWKEPKEEEVWAFPKSQFEDGDVLTKDFEEYITDTENIASNLRRKNNLSALW